MSIPDTGLAVGLRRALAASAAIAFSAPALAQSDHDNLEEGLPTRLEDAYPIGYFGREAQLSYDYERTDDDEERHLLRPRVEFGFAPNWQGKLQAPFYVGDPDVPGHGDVQLEALYNFNQESLTLPAFALAAKLDFPSGQDSEGVDTTLKAIVTRPIVDDHFGRLHLNLEWGHNSESLDGERDDTFAVVAGYSFLLEPDTIVVADFVREWEMERRHESNLVELGLRQQLDPLSVLSLGVAVGIGDESPELRVTLGFQYSF